MPVKSVTDYAKHASLLSLQVEVLSGGDLSNIDRPWNSTYCRKRIPESRSEVFPHVDAKNETPDYLWATPGTSKEKGKFLMVIEVKPEGSRDEGLFQLSKQVLSKMHEQDECFGLLVTPQRFDKVFMYKRETQEEEGGSKLINIYVETVILHKPESPRATSATAASTLAQPGTSRPSLSRPSLTRVSSVGTGDHHVFDVTAFHSVVKWLACIMKYAKMLKNSMLDDLVQVEKPQKENEMDSSSMTR